MEKMSMGEILTDAAAIYGRALFGLIVLLVIFPIVCLAWGMDRLSKGIFRAADASTDWLEDKLVDYRDE
jgi:hypothetical protein